MRELDVFPARDSAGRVAVMDTGHNPSTAYDEQYYDAQDGTYGGYEYDGRYADAAQKLVDEFDLKPGDKVLEIGCAKGFILYEFQQLGMNATGIEVSEYAIHNAHPDVKYNIMLWANPKLPYMDDTFDFVLCKEALPHVYDPDCMIKEIIRVAKPGQTHLEIQCATGEAAQKLMKEWDVTHQTVAPPSYWTNILDAGKYKGTYRCKELFSD